MKCTLPLLLGFGLVSLARAPVQPVHTKLLGATAERVLEQCGPPDRVRRGPFSSWSWQDRGNTWRSLTLHDDIVIHHDAGFDPETLRRPRPAKGAYPGQAVSELIARLGNPDAVRPIPITRGPPGPGARVVRQEVVGTHFVLVYGKEWVAVDRGRVVSAYQAPKRQPRRGPGR